MSKVTSKQPNSLLFIKRLVKTAVLPKRGTKGSAGYDLSSLKKVTIKKRNKMLIKTGLALKIPSGYYGRIAPRSGLTHKKGLDVGAGVIDSDYRGELGVILFNHSDEDVTLDAKQRIAQLIITKIDTPTIVEVDSLDDTERGSGGFGSTDNNDEKQDKN